MKKLAGPRMASRVLEAGIFYNASHVAGSESIALCYDPDRRVCT